ncbi:WhiB family transcriptional regulator [Actinomyces howellii]|uniref:Transcriptional regulator WhiB n=1 Tax=Actinomyces howellii TaxID=52771 RepID=A0A448HFY7_9ACTO|nr:WhiB family transcriptional regulator [Actinomyces howellii]VEG27506.1 Transcription factor WhiB [Actinomyces howellii]
MGDSARLPGPITALWEWQYRGACMGMDSTTFFHPEGERGSARRRRDEGAKAVCRTCEVLEICREHALSTHEPYGVWGGMTEEERRAVLAGRRSPPQDPVA